MSTQDQHRTPLPCVLPWKALFIDERDGKLSAVPCCAHWINRNYGPLTESTSLEELWNGPGAQEIRRLMASGRQAEMCSPDCFWLKSGRFSEDALTVIPGPPSFEENQRLNNQEIRERKTVLQSRPMAIRLIPTLRCNIRCRMCHQDHSASLHIPDGFLADVQTMGPYIYDYQLHGGEVITSNRISEWASPEWFEANPQMRLSLITNATHIPPSTWQLLERVRVNYITVSVNAATPETYKYMSGGFDLFDEVIANVVALRELGRRHTLGRFDVFLSYVIMRCNYHEIPAFVHLANQLGLTVRPLLVEGDRLGESIFTDPPILDNVIAAVDEAVVLCCGESLQNMRRIQSELQHKVLNSRRSLSLTLLPR